MHAHGHQHKQYESGTGMTQGCQLDIPDDDLRELNILRPPRQRTESDSPMQADKPEKKILMQDI